MSRTCTSASESCAFASATLASAGGNSSGRGSASNFANCARAFSSAARLAARSALRSRSSTEKSFCPGPNAIARLDVQSVTSPETAQLSAMFSVPVPRVPPQRRSRLMRVPEEAPAARTVCDTGRSASVQLAANTRLAAATAGNVYRFITSLLISLIDGQLAGDSRAAARRE